MQNNTRSFRAFLLILLFFCGTLACCTGKEKETASEQPQNLRETPAGSVPAERGLVRIAVSDPVYTMDVHREIASYMIPLNIYESLFEIRANEDGSMKLSNGLAEDWTVSDDGLTYLFTLRGDAYFSDGTPVKASDVVFTFTRMLALPESTQKEFGDMIRGARAVISRETDTLEGIRALDDRHVEITLSEPFSSFIYQLATPSCGILSGQFVTEAGDEYGSSAEKTLGSGPYRVAEYTPDEVILERNPYYHCQDGEELTVSRAIFRNLPPAMMDSMFRDGELDLLDASRVNPDIVKEVYDTPKWRPRTFVYNSVDAQYLMLNVEMSPLNDVRIRRAVQMAIDRQKIIDTVLNGYGRLMDGIYPKGLKGYSEENQGWLRYDPEEAARLISEVPEAKDAVLELAVNSETEIRTLTIMNLIRQDLIAVGLNVMAVNYDSASRDYLLHLGKLMVNFQSWSADFNDPDNFIYTFFDSCETTCHNSMNYCDESVISRVREARTIRNEAERLAEYAELERILIQDEAVWVPLYSADHMFVLGDRVERFTPYWAGWTDLYLKDIVLKPEARQ